MFRQLWNWILGQAKDNESPELRLPPMDEGSPFAPLNYVQIEESDDFWSIADLDFWEGRLRR